MGRAKLSRIATSENFLFITHLINLKAQIDLSQDVPAAGIDARNTGNKSVLPVLRSGEPGKWALISLLIARNTLPAGTSNRTWNRKAGEE